MLCFENTIFDAKLYFSKFDEAQTISSWRKKTFKCEICKHCFMTKQVLRRHNDSVHEKKGLSLSKL